MVPSWKQLVDAIGITASCHHGLVDVGKSTSCDRLFMDAGHEFGEHLTKPALAALRDVICLRAHVLLPPYTDRAARRYRR